MIKNFIKDTLTFIFKDKQIFQKSAFLILFMLFFSYSQLFAFNFFSSPDKVQLPFINFAVLFLLALFVLFFINGYKVDCIKNLMSKSEIPAFNLKKSCQFGIKYTLAAALFYIPLYYMITGCGFFGGFSVVTEHAVCGTIASVFLILTALLLLISALYNFGCLVGINRIFAETEDWFSFLRFKELFDLIKNNKKMYFVSVGLICVLAFLNTIILFAVNTLFTKLDVAYLTIIPVTIITLYEFFVSVFVASKFTEYQADQHQ